MRKLALPWPREQIRRTATRVAGFVSPIIRWARRGAPREGGHHSDRCFCCARLLCKPFIFYVCRTPLFGANGWIKLIQSNEGVRTDTNIQVGESCMFRISSHYTERELQESDGVQGDLFAQRWSIRYQTWLENVEAHPCHFFFRKSFVCLQANLKSASTSFILIYITLVSLTTSVACCSGGRLGEGTPMLSQVSRKRNWRLVGQEYHLPSVLSGRQRGSHGVSYSQK